MEPPYRVIYDEQCEICQAGVSWLKLLDRRKQTACFPIDPDILPRIHPNLMIDSCLKELHVVTPDGAIVTGADAVATLARLFPQTRIVGSVALFPVLRSISRALYRIVARNRYALSKCRGGACRVSRPADVQKRSTSRAFWSCYTAATLLRAPLSLATAAHDVCVRIQRYFLTFRKRIDLLDGRLQLRFLGGIPCDVVPLVFGEQFWTVIYDGAIIDPGSPKMRRSLARHLRALPKGEIQTVVATHHHENTSAISTG
jgi:predicted DCC family thiol-disulfide oxidoreductase YuxK